MEQAISKYAIKEWKEFDELTEEQARQVMRLININGIEELSEKALNNTSEEEEEEIPSGRLKQDQDTKGSEQESQIEKVEHPGSVYDAEKGEFVKIDPERQRVAMALQQRMDVATLVTAVALKKIVDEKYFLELGYSSMKEYANTALPFRPSSAKKYLQIGRKFADMLPDGWGEGERVPLLEDSSEENASKLSSLGVRKLLELTRVDDADFSEVVSEGVVKLADGAQPG